MSIAAFVLRRLLHALPLLVCVIVFNFFLIHLAPGDPIQALVGEFPAPESYIAEMRKVFGLDQPLYIQLLLYLKNILTCDLGFSFYYRQPVLNVILDRVPATLQLMVPALIFSAVIGILLGILSARKPYSLADHTISVFALFGYCVPAFWLGQMLMAAFAIELGWLPSQGIKTVGVDLEGFSLLLDRTSHVALPFAALAVRHLAVNARMMRSSMLEVAYEDFVTVARANGLDEKFSHHHGACGDCQSDRRLGLRLARSASEIPEVRSYHVLASTLATVSQKSRGGVELIFNHRLRPRRSACSPVLPVRSLRSRR